MEVVTVLSSLLPMLTNMLQAEYTMQKDLNEQLTSLSKELKSVLTALCEVQMVPWDELDDQSKNWTTELREAAYDMEDILDTFLVSVDDVIQPPEPDKVKQFFKGIGKVLRLTKKLKASHDIAYNVEGIMKNLMDIAGRFKRYNIQGLQSGYASATRIDPRLRALYEKRPNLVGINGPSSELTRMLFGDPVDTYNKEMKIVSVVGFGGLGKTTIAKVVQEQFKEDFKALAFVSVGRNPDSKKVLRDILIELGHTNVSDLAILDTRQLIDKIRVFLEKKRYFIVIDDLWDAELWSQEIRFAFDDNKLGSKIIVTTRKPDIAKEVEKEVAKGVVCSYEMKPLSKESSKELFYKRIFGSEGSPDEQLSEISRKILSKCGGVPLAIITISSMLAASKSAKVEDWSQVCESIGAGDGSSSGMVNMRKILSLSYYDLPSHLKTCLLYLSIFPEDYKIMKDRLVWRWIAEGFIQHGESENAEKRTLFEVGESYFNELMNRSLIQPSQMDKEGMPQACQVHDVVLDLIRSLITEQNFVTTVLDDTKQNKLSQIETVRRLALHCNTWPGKDMPKLRSLAIFNPTIIGSMPSLKCYGFLRVLDLEGCFLIGNDLSLGSIENLVHLRYIGLKNTLYSNKLPIHKLQFLHILNLIGTEIKELTSSIVKLGQLMCLYVDQSTRLPKGLSSLTSLQVLETAYVDSVSIAEDLGHLSELRKLAVDLGTDKEGRLDKGMCKALVMSLGKLHKLQTLLIFSAKQVELEGSVERLGNLGYLRIEKTTLLPTWISPASLPLLSHLEITVGKLRGADMEVLGKLPALGVLEVDVSGTGVKQVVEKFTVGKGSFPRLTKCRFCAYGVLPSMFAQGAMAKLQHLEFVILLDDFSDKDFGDLAMDRLSSLRSVRVALYGSRVRGDMGIKVQDTLKRMANVAHGNSPTIRIDDNLLYSDLSKAEEDALGPTGLKLFNFYQQTYQMIQDDPTALERMLHFLKTSWGNTYISGTSFGSGLRDAIRLVVADESEVSQVLYKMMNGTTISQPDLTALISKMGLSQEEITRLMSQQTDSRNQMMTLPDFIGMMDFSERMDLIRLMAQTNFSHVDMASLIRLISDMGNRGRGS